MDDESSRRKMRLVGMLLVLAFPIAGIGAWVTAMRQPRYYRSTATYELLQPDEDRGRMHEAFEKARRNDYVRHIPASAQVDLIDAGDGQIRITALHEEPEKAAQNANAMGIALLRTLVEGKVNFERMRPIQFAGTPTELEKLGLPDGARYALLGSCVLAVVGVGLVVRGRPRTAGESAPDGKPQGPTFNY
jgi:hypothetical protein